MIRPPECHAQLSRMHEARRQIQRQLDLIDRQITRQMTALIPQLKPKRTCYRRGKPFERPIDNPGQAVDRKAAELQMAALG